jgi:hypothetical protein
MRLDLGALVLPQQAVVDEDAVQARADGALDQERGDGGIDAAGEAAEHPCSPTAARILATASSTKLAMRPVAGEAAGVEEVDEHRGAALRVAHLGVELHAPELARGIDDRRRSGSCSELRDGAEAGPGAVTWSPWLIHTVSSRPLERARPEGLDAPRSDAAAVLALVGAHDLAARGARPGLEPVADAEHGDAELEEPAGMRGAPSSYSEDGPPDRQHDDARIEAPSAAMRSDARLNGTISANTPCSRTRRAMSCVTCEPKSTTRRVSCCMVYSSR